ncbi:glutamine synthetase cytosolic isozyme 1-1 [Dorcoceras hygrometricum]|uniref:Glutamine synthetase cytosolic isozyme 1-1 n=1 Tax=Dorcoceras hygrometricum TaxID=472368 RepID=A0A2Z7D0K0_9LAMI|nr:glutamine synthetase cytosolic isozyme 1-1 [Dorcoceras hygrometricum]
MKASGESSTTKHRLLHASGPHRIPPPNDPKGVGKRVKVRRLSCRVSMTFRVVRTNEYNQDLGLIHSTNGNHLESPNEGSLIDHQVTIHLHAQNITMFPTNETWYFASQMLVSSSGGLILILTAQSTRNEFRMHTLPVGPPPGPGGSNVTDLGSNRWLTRENWSLKVNAPAMLRRRDHLLVFTFVLHTPATNAGALTDGPFPGPNGSNKTNLGHNQSHTKENERWEGAAPSPGPGGSNVTNLGSNRGLTRENWSLQVNAPAMLRRRDHLLVFTFVLHTPATNAGALTDGPFPGPNGSNKTNLGHNQSHTKENERWEGAAPCMQKHTLRGALHLAIGSTPKPPLRTMTSHS